MSETPQSIYHFSRRATTSGHSDGAPFVSGGIAISFVLKIIPRPSSQLKNMYFTFRRVFTQTIWPTSCAAATSRQGDLFQNKY